MKEEGIEIQDFYSFVKENPEIQRKADVPFTAKGSKEMADEVVKALAIEAIGKKSSE